MTARLRRTSSPKTRTPAKSMTFSEATLRGINRFASSRRLAQRLLAWLVCRQPARAALNRLYDRFTFSECRAFHAVFAKIFRDRSPSMEAGVWEVTFADRTIRIPLQPETLWLDWDTGVSIRGNDIEVKETYEFLVASPFCPRYVVDVGANYGTHSLLFLSHGVRVVAFEPNPACHPIFTRLLRANGLDGKMEALAVGDAEAMVQLVFPERETWLGAIRPRAAPALREHSELRQARVQMICLDAYLAVHGIVPDLVKIDTEGFEGAVLRGAQKTLTAHAPLVVFEANDRAERPALRALLSRLAYEVFALPVKERSLKRLGEREFLESKGTNFMAIPRRHPLALHR